MVSSAGRGLSLAIPALAEHSAASTGMYAKHTICGIACCNISARLIVARNGIPCEAVAHSADHQYVVLQLLQPAAAAQHEVAAAGPHRR